MYKITVEGKTQSSFTGGREWRVKGLPCILEMLVPRKRPEKSSAYYNRVSLSFPSLQMRRDVRKYTTVYCICNNPSAKST